jgi:sulfate/thiosulfate transport system substrate-binding protein
MRAARRTAPALLIGAVALLAAACGGSSAGASGAGAGGGDVQLSLVAYSTPQAAYAQLIKAFQATPAGKGVTFKQSYGASGDQSRAVAAGLDADVVAFSLETDITRLVKAGLVDASWSTGPTKGIVTDSVVVIGTRKGNPKNLRTWDDLVKPGVQVLTPNPFTSGGARWNVLAAYGAQSARGKDDAKGLAYLNKLFHNVPVQDDSGRKSLQTFTQGKGDAFLSYENEAIFAQKNGQPVDYTIPDSTLLIENPVAVTKDSKHPKEAKAFLDFLLTQPAQKIFADNGYRPVVSGVPGASFPKPAGLFTIKDLGGWNSVTTKFFDPQKGALVGVERDLGVSVKK